MQFGFILIRMMVGKLMDMNKHLQEVIIMESKENKIGRWLSGNMPTYGGYKCSECGYQTVEYKLEKCPFCKTEMYIKYVGYKK